MTGLINIKRIALFGSTGSIGTQALEVIAANPDKFSVEILTAQNNEDLLIQQALQFNPNVVVIGDEKKYPKNGPPDAVRITFSIRFLVSPTRH